MPGATVTVYEAGTATLATGLQDESGSPLANPFAADSSAKVAFYAPDGLYDITVVGNGRTVTIRAQFVSVDGASVLRADLAAPGGSALVGFQQEGAGAVARTSQDKLRETVSVKDFGAVGDGVTDDTAAIQACANTLSDGQVLYFPKTGARYKFTSVTLNKPRIKVRGDGVLDGTLIIQSNNDPRHGREMFFDISGMSFHRFDQNADDHIVLKNCFYGRITNCSFKEGNAAIRVPQNTLDTQFQNVGRVIVANNTYQSVNRFIQIDAANANYSYSAADWIVEGNQGLAYYDHVAANTIDGLTCDANIFFFPYESNKTIPPMTTKSACVTIANAVHVFITNNKCFESGTNSIALQDVIHFTVQGNEHATPGQRVQSAAVSVNYTTVPEENVGVIANETIVQSSGVGILLIANCRSIAVHDNNIFIPGDNSKLYYPGHVADRRGVVVAGDAGNQHINVHDNLTTFGTYGFYDGSGNTNTFRSNKMVDVLGNYTVVDRANVLESSSGAYRDLIVDRYDMVVLTGESYFEVSSITQNAFGSRYREITLYFNTSNGVVGPPTANLVLKGGVAVAVPQNGVMTFLCEDGGKSIELSRNF
jgi:hypothetical protein